MTRGFETTPGEFERQFNEALLARNEDRADDAVSLLETLLATDIDRATVAMTLTTTLLYEKDKKDKPDPARAERLLSEAMVLRPRSEIASVALLHALVDLGRRGDAFAEAKRFLVLRDSEEYSRMLREMTDYLRTRRVVDDVAHDEREDDSRPK